jgi:hypothetical protein
MGKVPVKQRNCWNSVREGMPAALPGRGAARGGALEGRNHTPLEDEPSWTRLVAEVRGFLAETPR